MTDVETQEQKQERIHKHLEGVIERMERVINSATEIEMKHIEVDAAATAVLAIVSELLPEQIQEQIRTIVGLHEKTWKIDMPSVEGETPHIPLPEELIDTIIHADKNNEASSQDA